MAKATTTDTGKPVKTPKASKTEKPNVFVRIVRFLPQYVRDVRGEMRRVVWPARPEVVNSSMVVIVTLLFFVAITFVLDGIVLQLLDLIRELR